MTHLTQRRTKLIFTSADVVREQGRFREVVIEAHPMHATVRLKGMRTGYDIPWSAIWSAAVKMQLAAEKREKAAKKAGR